MKRKGQRWNSSATPVQTKEEELEFFYSGKSVLRWIVYAIVIVYIHALETMTMRVIMA